MTGLAQGFTAGGSRINPEYQWILDFTFFLTFVSVITGWGLFPGPCAGSGARR
jgi:hypothetical protein